MLTTLHAGSKNLTLTIDDGWNPLVAKVMLENLRHSWVYATWFLVGHAMLTSFGDNPRMPDPERWVRSENRRLMWFGNHEVAYHSMRHEPMDVLWKRTRMQWQVDYEEWRDTFHDVFVVTAPGKTAGWPSIGPYARAPWGQFTDAFMEVCEDNDLTPIGWSQDLTEWRWGRPMKSGDIVLAHSRLADTKFINHMLYLRRTDEWIVSDIWHHKRARELWLERIRSERDLQFPPWY